MKKRLISLMVAAVMLFGMLCPAAYADDGAVSFDTCVHEWETPIRSGYSITIPNSDVSFGVNVEQCKKCKWYKHVATIIVAEFTYYSPFNVNENGLIPTELATFWANVWYKTFGKNATAEKAPSGIGRKDLPGYADDNGTPVITANGEFFVTANCVNINSLGESASYATEALKNNPKHISVNSDSISSDSWPNYSMYLCYEFTAPVDGTYSYYAPAGEYLFTLNVLNDSSWKTNHAGAKNIYLGSDITASSLSRRSSFVKSDKVNVCVWIYGEYPRWDDTYVYSRAVRATGHPIIIKVIPLESNKQTTITINNNTWNGNIYTDNSTNLTYIYPQYTTINEKNETVTNISNTPIIYNNETKKYYTYDTVTNNYYYITYEQPATPTPSPSPTPAPTEKPGGSISTPETGKPGGDTGDTTGILAVLVEIRDNMIQGFLDIKAAFVAGFAELSANFTLAIENLNVNIQNTFNKKFPDQSTPETAQPTPTPSPEPTETPSPTDPPSPTPSPSPAPTGKPDGGGDTNNFWNIFIGGGSDDGTDGDHKGIFWALVSLILALIAFFTNLFAGVAYLFPFLPEGVVMTINTCLFVVFLFVIIKFIMRSK